MNRTIIAEEERDVWGVKRWGLDAIVVRLGDLFGMEECMNLMPEKEGGGEWCRCFEENSCFVQEHAIFPRCSVQIL